MAGGYLGKISAVVSANTGDYVRKLSESAKETRDFAKTVESTLRRASSEAARSLQGIYTPLQQFERALRAAASEKLSFKGFEGAIRTVDELKRRIDVLRGSDLEVAFRVTGMKSVQEIKSALNSISQKDLDLFGNIGGFAGIRKALADLDAVQEKADSITVKPKVSREQLLDLQQKLSVLDDKTIGILINITNKRELDDAVTSARQMRDVLQDVTQPLTRVTQGFTQLGGEAQAAFIPALAAAQREAEKLALSFSPERYAAATRSVASLAATVNQLAEAQRLASQVPTGRELAFSDPRLNENLRAAAGAGQQAAALSASAIAGDPEFSGLTSQLNRVSELAVAAAARLKSLRETGSPGQSQAAAEFDRLNGVLEQLTSRLNQKFQVRIDAEKAIADAQKLDQAISQFRLEIASGSLNVLQNESRAISQTGESLAAYESRLQAASDARMRASATGQMFLNVLQRESDLLSTAGSIGQTNIPLPPGFGGSPDAGLGPDIADSQRQLDSLRGSLTSIKSQFDSLPAGLRTQLIPAIQQAEANFRRLAASGVSATATEIENAANEVERLNATISRASQSAELLSFDEFINNASVRQATGELQALQQILVNIGAVAGGPAAQAYDRYRQRLQEAINAGTTGLPRVRQELEALQADAAMAAAATGQISFDTAMRGIQRGGDVARDGVDNASLALQQAAFAVDDFLSSTGGLDQKLRAVSNNVTQLAFILGSTKGLFIGLGAVIAGQAAVALIKFANGGKTAEDQTNALNDALARQKSLVQELAQAFESLGSAIANRSFSEPGRRAAEFSDELSRIAKKQKELREGSVAGLDPRVQQERADQARIERELKTQTDAGRRLALERQLRDSREREQRAAAEATAAAPTRDEVARALRQSADTQFLAEASRFRQGDISGRNVDPTFVRQSARADAAAATNDPFQQLTLLRQQRDELIASGLGAGFAGDIGVNQSIRELETLIKQLEAAAREAADALAIDFLRSSNAAANELETAQARTAQAIESAVPSAVTLQRDLDGFANQIKEAQARIKDSIENEKLTAEERKAIVEKAEKEIADARIKREEATAKAAQLAFQRIVDPRGLLENVIGRSQQSLQDSGFADGRVARDLRVLEAQRQDLEARINERPDDALTRGVVQSGLDAINQQAAALEAATLALRAFGEALNSITQSAAQDVGSLQQRAEQARRDDIRFGTPDTAQRRSQAEADLRAGRDAQRQVENSVQNARDRAEQQIVDNGTRLGERLRQIDDQLAVPAGQTSSTGVQGGTLAEREALRNERAMLQAQLDAAVENDPGVRAARRQRDELTRQAEAATGADRGRLIGMTDAQRAIEQTQAQLADVRDRAGQMFQPGQANRDVADFLRQSRDTLARDAAPAIFSMADQVMNAALQGPSRAALTAADVNTSQGAAELNRLLRGDDQNRNANIVELQKQNTTLTAINQGIQQMADNMGIVIDL